MKTTGWCGVVTTPEGVAYERASPLKRAGEAVVRGVSCGRGDGCVERWRFGTLAPMKSNATTVKEYLASLPEDRRVAVEAVRRAIVANLDKDYEECMLWGVAAYVVPHRVWPEGHHTDPKKPVMMCGVSSQKNDMVVYMMNVFGGGGGLGGDTALREWFSGAWVKAGKTMGMCVEGAGGGGCCIRFRKLEDISLDVIGEAVRRTPVKVYVERHVKGLADRGGKGRGAEGKKVKGEKKVAKKVAVKKKAGKKVAKKTAKR